MCLCMYVCMYVSMYVCGVLLPSQSTRAGWRISRLTMEEQLVRMRECLGLDPDAAIDEVVQAVREAKDVDEQQLATGVGVRGHRLRD